MTARRRSRRQASGTPGTTQIGPGTVASLGYELFDAEGERVEVSEPGSPLVLLFGYGEAVPALEQGLSGLSAGDTRDVTLPPEDAFGPRRSDAIIEVDRAEFPPDLELGDELEAERDGGEGAVPLRVVEIADDVVVLDTNHPLAGQRVRLRVVVQAVRPASAEEIAEATARLTQAGSSGAGHLLPAERLLRRGRGESAPDRDEPPPPPSGRVA